MIPQRRIRAFIFLALANLLASVSCQQICGGNGNYTTNSTYHANLNTLLSILPANVDENGFYNASVGQNTDTVYACVLCRGDLQLDECRTCIQEAAVAVVELCPNQRHATFFSESCLVRYSDHSVFRTVALSPGLVLLNIINATSPDEFNTDQTLLLENLRPQAAHGGSLRKVAVGSRSTTNSQTIYALVQCTPDLNADDCTTCLTTVAQELPRQDLRVGARVQCPSCNIRYETQSFYNESRLLELEPMPVVPTAPPMPVAPTPSSMPVPARPPESGDRTARIRIIAVTVVSVSAGLILFIFVGFLLRKKMEPKSKEQLDTNEISIVESLHYEFDEVKSATNDFSEANKLGQGGFGAVYRGKLRNGQEIAVKRLSTDSSQGDSEFKNEVLVLAKLQHRNLIRLLGFSLEGTEKLLVYEYLQNTSLDRFIFEPQTCSKLDWDKRYKIVRGIARGLLYLHEDSQLRIIHRDLKASNILLDEDMNPKIADFGSARLFVPDESHANTFRIVGTYGYMAPEYVMHGQFSVKSDVFSFGVLVLEIVSGQKNNRFRDEENGEDLLTRVAWRSWQQRNVSNLVDPFLRGSSGIPGDIWRCIHIGLLCVQKRAIDRPTMASVVLMLNSFSYTLQVPSEPAFYVASDCYLEAPLTEESNSKENNGRAITSGYLSENSVSLTEFYPR